MSAPVNNSENKKHNKKHSFFGLLMGTKSELKKVHWPNKKELIKYTGVVLSTCFFMTMFVWAIDSGIGYVLKSILK